MKLPRRLAASCHRFWSWLISPSLLFAAVMLAFPAFLFQKNVMVLVGEATAFFFLALSRRGKLRLLPSLLMIAGITVFSLFSPHGQVVARLGTLAITTGALETGLRRGVTLAGMVFLSQLAVSPQVGLPGRVGAFVVDMFGVLEQLVGKQQEFRQALRKKDGAGGVMAALDQRLYQVYWQREKKEPDSIRDEDMVRCHFTGRGIVVMLAWLGMLYSLLVWF
ncbi:MAG: hypothetical protein IJC31_03700 [Spirochaetaceae bacterium]|nr:hypothetical protein [Spirochaetaceae bacterium]